MTESNCFCDGRECQALALWGKESCGECCRPKNTITRLKLEVEGSRAALSDLLCALDRRRANRGRDAIGYDIEELMRAARKSLEVTP
jgi:hypothetical protein